jgi:hypothetical protein
MVDNYTLVETIPYPPCPLALLRHGEELTKAVVGLMYKQYRVTGGENEGLDQNHRYGGCCNPLATLAKNVTLVTEGKKAVTLVT